MDLNKFDFSNYDNDDYPTFQESPNLDLNDSNPNYISSFTQLISGSQNFQNIDVFENSMSLSQLPTQTFVEETPIYCAKKSNQQAFSKKDKGNSKKNESRIWSEKEDEALMSAWCLSSTDSIVGKNQNNITRWNKVFDLYEQSRVENQNKTQLGIRSIDAMKSRFKRLNFLVNKWVGCYNQVLNRPPASGTNIGDDIESAQQLFRKVNDGNDFVDFNVYNNVMSKHQKWCLQQSHFGVSKNISSSGSKRSRSEMDSSPSNVNVSTPPSVGSTPYSVNIDEDINQRPEGRETAKKNRKGKNVISNSMFSVEDISALEGHRFSEEAQIEHRRRRIEADLEIEKLRILNTKTKMEMKMLNTLLSRHDLNPNDEKMKEKLQNKYMSDI